MIRFDAGHGLNLRRAEEAVSLLAGSVTVSNGVDLDLSQIRHVDVGAGWRLGNALRPYAGQAIVRVALPKDFDIEGSWCFRHITRSGLGFAIAKCATEVTRGDELITELVRAYYGRPRRQSDVGIAEAWQSASHVLVPGLEGGTLPTESIASFNLVFRRLLPSVRLDLNTFPQSDAECLVQFLFEAVQNVWDHARENPLPAGTGVLGYLSLRAYRKVQPPRSLTQRFGDYLRSVPARLPGDTDWLGFVEIIVNDDGVGLAARHAGTFDVYEGDLEDEREIFADALAAGSSIKLRDHDATVRGVPGFGFTKILDSLRQLTAFAVLRTGRVTAVFDATKDHESFFFDEAKWGSLPGTTLQVLLPRRVRRIWTDV